MMVEKEKEKKRPTRRVADDKVEVTFRLPRDLTVDIKTRAVQEGRSYSDVVVEGMREFMSKKK